MDEVEFHAPPRESKSKRWLSFHPFPGIYIYTHIYYIIQCSVGKSLVVFTNNDYGFALTSV